MQKALCAGLSILLLIYLIHEFICLVSKCSKINLASIDSLYQNVSVNNTKRFSVKVRKSCFRN